jgi:hypothetical protein
LVANELFREGRNDVTIVRVTKPTTSSASPLPPFGPWQSELRIGPLGDDGKLLPVTPLADALSPITWANRGGQSVATVPLQLDSFPLSRTPYEAADAIDATSTETRTQAWNLLRDLHSAIIARDVAKLLELGDARTSLLARSRGEREADLLARARDWWELYVSTPSHEPLPAPEELILEACAYGRGIEIFVAALGSPPLKAVDPETRVRLSMHVSILKRGPSWIWIR